MSWIPCLIVACIFYILTAYKLAKNMDVHNWFNLKLFLSRLHAHPLMDVFYRDGSIFFGMIFFVILLNTVFNVIGGTYLEIGAPWLSATYSVATISASPNSTLEMRSFSAAPGTFRAVSNVHDGTETYSIPLHRRSEHGTFTTTFDE
ncbi:hypothetical protein BKA93DRAFT_307130 [Sparassis latifolia]